MKKVIDGKNFNTETALEICDGGHNECSTEFDRFSETLYKTKKGAYFVAGNGGPMSKYAEHSGANETTGGESMKLVTESEALKFCERYELEPEKIAEHFEITEG